MLAPNEESKSKYSRGRSMVAVDRSGGRYEEPSNSYALANPHNLFNSLMKEHQQTMKAFDNMSSDLMSFGLRSNIFIKCQPLIIISNIVLKSIIFIFKH